MTDGMTLREAEKLAQKCAHTGIPAGPIHLSWNEAKGRTEKIPKTKHGFQDFTTDPHELRELFRTARDPRKGAVWGVGIRPGVGGYVVLDLDVAKDGAASGEETLAGFELVFDDLPQCATATTASGGKHVYLRKPKGLVIGNGHSLGPGIDVRSDNGFVVAPGVFSPWGDWTLGDVRVSDTSEAPEWLLGLFKPATARDEPMQADSGPAFEDLPAEVRGSAATYAERAVEYELSRLDDCDLLGWVGAPWDQTTYEVACNLIELSQAAWTGLDPDEVHEEFLDRAPVDDGFGPEEHEAKWRSARGKVGSRGRPLPEMLAAEMETEPESITRCQGRTAKKAQCKRKKDLDEHGYCTDHADQREAQEQAQQRREELGSWVIPDKKQPLKVARALRTTFASGDEVMRARSWYQTPEDEREEGDEGRPNGIRGLRFWNECAYQFADTHYREVDSSTVRARLYRFLDDCYHNTEDEDGDITSWDPNKNSVTEVLDAMRAEYMISPEVADETFIDRYGEPAKVGSRERGHISVANGILDVREGTIEDHTSNFFTRFSLPVAWDPDAVDAPIWDEFLRFAFDGEDKSIRLLHEWIAYLISGRTDLQKMMMLTGQPRSGKDTIVKVIEALLGSPSVCSAKIQDFGNSSFGMSKLIDSSLCVINEANTKGENQKALSSVSLERVTSTLKELTGESKVSIPRKYINDWAGYLRTRYMLVGNNSIDFRDNSGAIAGRLLYLRTKRSVYGNEDLRLLDKILEELPAILNRCLAIVAEMDKAREAGDNWQFTEAEDGARMRDMVRADASPFDEWVRQYVVVDPILDKETGMPTDDLTEDVVAVTAAELRQHYNEYRVTELNAKENSTSAPAFRGMLYGRFPKLKSEPRGNKNVVHYPGLSLADVDMSDGL